MHKRIRIIEMVFSLDVELGGGGITRFATGLAKKLDPLRFDVTLCSLSGSTTNWSQDRIMQLNNLGIRLLTCNPWIDDKPLHSFTQALMAIQKDVKQHPIDILHSHSEFSDIAALFLKISTGIPIIIRTVHNGYWLEWRKRPWRRIIFTNFLFPLVYNLEIGVNQTITDQLNRRWLSRPLKHKAIMVPNALELDRFVHFPEQSHMTKQSLAIPGDALVIGTIGRLTEEKGFHNLIDAAKLVLQKKPDVFFVMIGSGPLSDELQSHARSIGIVDRMLFLGPRSDVERLLGLMDLFVCTSLWEGLPTAVLESMAAGVPIIASDIPGIRSLIRHGENGWLVSPRNIQDFSTAIIFLLDSPLIRKSLSLNAGATVRNYSIESVTRQHEVLYSRLLNNNEKIIK